MNFPHYTQLDAMDCGPTCLRMIAKHYGKTYTLQTLRDKSYITRDGVSLLGISDAAESIGFRTMGVRISLEQLINEAPLPCIIHWKQNHFVVLYKIKIRKSPISLKRRGAGGEVKAAGSEVNGAGGEVKTAGSEVKTAGSEIEFHISDPAHGLVKYTKEEFLKCWLSTKTEGEERGICLLLEPGPDFYTTQDEKPNKSDFRFLLSYLKPHRKFMMQLGLGLLAGSLLQLIFPFLTQSIVDVGIANQNVGFIYLVLIAQLVLYVGRTSIEFIRGWILLHISTRINISLISDFLIKLMKLPIGFFDIKMTGDLLQRIGDHSRIQNFLTSTSLSIVFSFVNLIIFGLVLAFYSLKIFAVFLVGSVLYAAWIYIFMKKRRDLDYKRFAQMSANQSNLIQLIQGMQEIKLNNCEKQKRWVWERIQAQLFRVSIKSLSLTQTQQAGSVFINEVKNIIISFLAATAVIKGDMTLGMMLSVQYIIGQLNSPIEQMLGFMQSAQDAKISLERLGEIHNKPDEEKPEDSTITEIPAERDIQIENVSFQYEGPHSEMVLKNINLIIPKNKITAIVGTSGSGKTTLIKLLLGFYKPVTGEIKIGDTTLENFNQRLWRQKCGVVMQDGFIFSDSIANNIAVSDETVDKKKLHEAVSTANIKEFIEKLPLRYNTKIGQEGSGISQGQKQRILIARAVYKNPDFIFFDEATNALDANNEKIIMENLEQFFQGRTGVVVAHRLSTVKNADQIVVLEKGEVVEIGTHNELTARQGAYYNLVKNQLELGN